MEHMRGMYKTNPKAFAEWKEWCMYVHLLTDIFGTLDDPKEFDEEKTICKRLNLYIFFIFSNCLL